MAILNRIRQLRVESDDMSQAQLARQIDVSRQTLNAVERGQRMPSLEIAHRIADALDCNPVSYTHLTLPTNTNACSYRWWADP